jgi:cyclic pyranopterin phosphate synthase
MAPYRYMKGLREVSERAVSAEEFCNSMRPRNTCDKAAGTELCLFATTETDLCASLRSGASDDQFAGLWRTAVAAKLLGHGISDPGFLQPVRPMSAIGD